MSGTLSGAKILVTGVTGQIGRPLAAFLAKENDVWGVARFRQDGAAESVAGLGITPVALELSRGDYRVLPDDFTHVVHLAAFMGPGLDFDKATRITAEGTGLLLHHCRKAKAALVMSTHSVYRPHEDPWHAYNESDPLGDAGSEHSPTYSMSKIGEEAVARSCARTLGLPVLIARMNACYGPGGGLPAYQLDAVVAGSPVVARWEPSPYSLIHQDDVNTQAAALMEAASVPATIVNWAGDEPATVREWCSYAASLAGLAAEVSVEERPASQRGAVADTGRRRAITGLCKVGWREGIRETLIARHPGLVKEMTA
jgi:nucleoside-diphosphate-sugar epimerase